MVSWKGMVSRNEQHTSEGRLLAEAGLKLQESRSAEAAEVLVLDLCMLERHKKLAEVEERPQRLVVEQGAYNGWFERRLEYTKMRVMKCRYTAVYEALLVRCMPILGGLIERFQMGSVHDGLV
jgi:hypothetical protein